MHDAISWYVEQGWMMDAEGDSLMRERPIEEAELFEVQQILRKAYQVMLDRTNTAFSEFIALNERWPEQSNLPYAGDELKKRLDERKGATAVVVIDALRFELGKRLAGLINEEQTSPAAFVRPCIAPVPTTTELGMAYALPGIAKSLRVSVDPEKGWLVHAEKFDHNLAGAESRRDWLNSVYGVKPSHILSVTDAVKTGFKLPEGKLVLSLVAKSIPRAMKANWLCRERKNTSNGMRRSFGSSGMLVTGAFFLQRIMAIFTISPAMAKSSKDPRGKFFGLQDGPPWGKI